MWSHRVEFLDESIEPKLLTAHGCCRRPSGFLLEGLVHSFVTSVLRGPAWLDELGKDAQPNPPDRQAAQPSDGRGRKRCTVVGPDDSRKTELLEQLRKDRLGQCQTCGMQAFASEQVPTVAIRHCQRVAVDSIAGLEFSFVVSAPHVVGSRHRCFRLARMTWVSSPSFRLDQPVALQQVRNS